MKQFITKLLFFICIFIIFILIGTFIGNNLLKNNSCFKVSEKTKYIVLGHSHPACAFNDSLINNFSNFCELGESYFYTYLKTRIIIANNKQIKTVFIEFTNNQLMNEKDTVWTWGEIHLQHEFRSFFRFMDYSDFKLLWIKNYKGVFKNLPNALMINIGHNLLTALGLEKNIKRNNDFGGFYYLTRDETDSLCNLTNNNLKEENINCEIAENNISYLAKTIEYCKQNSVQVLLIRSPLHAKYTCSCNDNKFKETLSHKLKNIEFLDFKDFPLQNHEFGDFEHLNHKGAEIFSKFFNRLLDFDLLKKENKQEFINDEIKKWTKK